VKGSFRGGTVVDHFPSQSLLLVVASPFNFTYLHFVAIEATTDPGSTFPTTSGLRIPRRSRIDTGWDRRKIRNPRFGESSRAAAAAECARYGVP